MFSQEDTRIFFHTYLNFRSTLFWLHQRRELKRFKEFFDSVEKKPLTDQQRRPVRIGGGRGSDTAAMERIVRFIARESRGDDPSLLILSRYNHDLPDRAALSSFEKLWPGEIMSPLHRSKGLEADYVIVRGLTADRYGFPSEIEDDPLLSLVLAKPEDFPHAEERRLFYVALTRARQQVHLLVDRRRPSAFALELRRPEYNTQHIDGADDVEMQGNVIAPSEVSAR